MSDGFDRRSLLRLGAVLGAGPLAGCPTTGTSMTPVGRSGLESGGWPGFGHDGANTGHADDAGPTGYGSTAWARDFDDGQPEDPRSPGGVVVDGAAFVASTTRFRALSLRDGTERWSREGGSASTPTVVDGVCYRRVAGGDSSPVEAIDIESGEREWRHDLPRRYHRGGITAGERALYVAGGPRSLYCLAQDGGDRIWTVGDPVSLGAPAIDAGRLFLTTTDGVEARDAATGERQWQQDLFGFDAPALADDRVVVGTRSGVRTFGTDGEPRWMADLGGPVRGTPAVAAGTVVAATRAGTVHGLSASDGAVQWEAAIGGRVVAPVSVAGGVVYVPDARGAVVALSLTDGSRQWRAGLPAGARGPLAVAGERLLAWDETNRATLLRSLSGGLSFPSVGQWRYRYGTPRGTNRAPAATLPTAPTIDWELPRTVDTGELLVAGGRVFHPSADAITARSAASGRADWQYTDVDQGDLPSVFGLDDGGLYVGVDDRLLRLAPDDATDRVQWSVDLPTGYLITGATPVDGTVYATGTRAAEVAAIDAATGETEWSVTQGPRFSHPPAVDDDTVYVGSLQGEVLAIDRASGAVRGEVPFGGQAGPIAVADGTAYAATKDGAVLAVEPPDATTPRWETEFEEDIQAPLAVGDRSVYVVTRPGQVVALDREAGDRGATTRLSGEFTAAPRLVGDTLLVGGWAGPEGAVHALSASDLSERWRASIFAGPAYGGGGEGVVTAVAPVDGRLFVLGSGLAALS